jgi:hypothetical protein
LPGVRNSILATAGTAPDVRIGKIAPAGVELFVKVESFNPLGSVKDSVGRTESDAVGVRLPALLLLAEHAIDLSLALIEAA